MGVAKPVNIGEAATSLPIKDKKVLVIDLCNFSAELFERSVTPYVLGKMPNSKQELREFLALLESKNITPIFRVEGMLTSRNEGGLLEKYQWKCHSNERAAQEVFGDVSRALESRPNSGPFFWSQMHQFITYMQYINSNFLSAKVLLKNQF